METALSTTKLCYHRCAATPIWSCCAANFMNAFATTPWTSHKRSTWRCSKSSKLTKPRSNICWRSWSWQWRWIWKRSWWSTWTVYALFLLRSSSGRYTRNSILNRTSRTALLKSCSRKEKASPKSLLTRSRKRKILICSNTFHFLCWRIPSSTRSTSSTIPNWVPWRIIYASCGKRSTSSYPTIRSRSCMWIYSSSLTS